MSVCFRKYFTKFHLLKIFLLPFIITNLLGVFSVSAVTRIKDIASVEGVRDNLLVGQGLVVGLNGTGDNIKNTLFTKKDLTDFLEKLGVNVEGADLKTKNIAAVTVTANLQAFARQGNKIDVRVSAFGDSKSLRGGMLLPTPLLGADGDVYAVAQGAVAISEFVPVSQDVKTKSRTIETNGYIQNGAIVETEIDFNFSDLDTITLSLHSPDFKTAIAVSDAINSNIAGNTAKALDSASIKIIVPNHRKHDLVNFISEIESLDVVPDYKAKIVINEYTGTIVIGDKVSIRPVAIAHGNLTVNVGQLEYKDSLPLNLAEETRDLIDSTIDSQRGRAVHNFPEVASLSDLVSGLNKLGVMPHDIINILYNMKSVGALDAVIEVR